ncbi:MAG TPA: hypothetical protein VJ803_01275 [Gemmatimonadaceae bacterium]|nr:hypothetical protein [Gemmatimonadaceae bacterium]
MARTTGTKQKPARDIEAILIASVQEAVEIAQGKRAPARMYSMPMTARKVDVIPPPQFTSSKVYQVREQLGVSQAVMAKLLNVSAPAVRAWEQPKSKGKPSGAAARLLEIAAKHPQVVLGSMSVKPSARKQPASSRRGSMRAAPKQVRKRA